MHLWLCIDVIHAHCYLENINDVAVTFHKKIFSLGDLKKKKKKKKENLSYRPPAL